MATIPPVFEHLETHFGRIDSKPGYWRFPLGGQWLQVVTFKDHPRKGRFTLCTLGMWHHQVNSPTGPVQQELVLVCEDRLATAERLACLFPCVGEALLASRVALVPGQIFGPLGPIIAEVSPLEWLLCLPPKPFPSSFAICDQTTPQTHITWLVGISAAEADQVSSGNLASLELRWTEERVDLSDWHRKG